jgi:hypothetical protein
MKINKISYIWISKNLLYFQMDKLLGIVDQYAAKHDILEKYYVPVFK